LGDSFLWAVLLKITKVTGILGLFFYTVKGMYFETKIVFCTVLEGGLRIIVCRVIRLGEFFAYILGSYLGKFF
jgi:hypothetical protein